MWALPTGQVQMQRPTKPSHNKCRIVARVKANILAKVKAKILTKVKANFLAKN